MHRPIPSELYKKKQRKLQLLSETNSEPGERTKLEKALEKEFSAAWGFTPDRLRLSYKLRSRLHGDRGLDHVSYLTGPNDERVIVTQPYGDFADQLRTAFVLDGGVGPDAFYFPGRAALVVLVFPPDYAKSLDKFRRRQERERVRLCLAGELGVTGLVHSGN